MQPGWALQACFKQSQHQFLHMSLLSRNVVQLYLAKILSMLGSCSCRPIIGPGFSHEHHEMVHATIHRRSTLVACKKCALRLVFCRLSVSCTSGPCLYMLRVLRQVVENAKHQKEHRNQLRSKSRQVGLPASTARHRVFHDAFCPLVLHRQGMARVQDSSAALLTVVWTSS